MKKVVILGPESTGKSTLAKQLAAHYNSLWVPEFAREFLLKHGNIYRYEDLIVIAKGQLTLEEEYLVKAASGPGEPSLLFLDTDMYVMKVWCEFVFGKCHQWILDQVVKRKYDLYLLCNTDLPWVEDELREYPDLESRQKLFHMYKDIMVNQQLPWINVTGNNRQRLESAIKGIDQQFAISSTFNV